MREIIDIPISAVTPPATAVLAAQGVPGDPANRPDLVTAAESACRLFSTMVAPRGILAEIGMDDFSRIFAGFGLNTPAALLEAIYPQADALALVAVTSGSRVSKKIAALFAAGDFVLGSLLDTAASEGTDRASRYMETYYHHHLTAHGKPSYSPAVLCYSPGYCGWHISAQRALFEALAPEKIGITLRESFLMNPLKSVSGVLVAGPPEIHVVTELFPYCGECKAQSCRSRLQNKTDQ